MKRRIFTASESGTLGEVLARALRTTRTEAVALIVRGAVYVRGKRERSSNQSITAGTPIVAILEETGQPVVSEAIHTPPIDVLYEDEEMLAINKAPGVASQPTPGRVGDSLLDAASAYLKRPAGLVHRLDRQTSGLIVFGKNADATSRLAEAFRLGQAQKIYLAVVAPGLPAEGTIDLPLSKDPSRPGRWRASKLANGIPALTDFQRLGDATSKLVALFPKTGRTHQLRAHLTALGFPIDGDKLYGGSPGLRCLLHAYQLCILGKTYTAPVPSDFPFVDESMLH